MKIKVKGSIISNNHKWIYDYFEMDSTCPKDVETQLEAAKGGEVEVEINSPGGDVYAGAEIYTALKNYKGKKLGKIVGVAASAASVIAMGVDKLIISPVAQIMIHNVWSWASGDYKTFEHEAEVLKGWSESLANAYIKKTGMSKEELMALMDKETWMTAEQAIKLKFADEIMFEDDVQLAASVKSALLPPAVIEKMMAQKQNTKPDETEPVDTPKEPRQVPVDLYNKLHADLERRAKIC